MHVLFLRWRDTFQLVTDQGTNRYELYPFTLERKIIYFSTVKTVTKKKKTLVVEVRARPSVVIMITRVI